MLILLYYLIMKVVLPQLVAYVSALVEPVMIFVIMLAGIVMIFSAVGIKISNNLGTTIVKGLFSAIGYLGKTVIRAIGILIRSICKMIPRLFNKARRSFAEMGMKDMTSNLLAALIVVVVILIII